ncbi:hypothetical protein E2986_13338 [Frieseomelitta varia]|uniref:Chemosensory protein n=1 Tax=Frieseomelitta varia TaxID=561572 RepID=A0A833RLT4_9HYME|nr:hypothetical protein E2986_13338 [Frieseomelitta varia]
MLVCALADQKYTTKYDNIDLDSILNSDRLLNNYVNCLLDVGSCTPDGKELKKSLPDALESDCEKCSEKQKTGSEKVIRFLINKAPRRAVACSSRETMISRTLRTRKSVCSTKEHEITRNNNNVDEICSASFAVNLPARYLYYLRELPPDLKPIKTRHGGVILLALEADPYFVTKLLRPGNSIFLQSRATDTGCYSKKNEVPYSQLAIAHRACVKHEQKWKEDTSFNQGKKKIARKPEILGESKILEGYEILGGPGILKNLEILEILDSSNFWETSNFLLLSESEILGKPKILGELLRSPKILREPGIFRNLKFGNLKFLENLKFSGNLEFLEVSKFLENLKFFGNLIFFGNLKIFEESRILGESKILDKPEILRDLKILEELGILRNLDIS